MAIGRVRMSTQHPIEEAGFWRLIAAKNLGAIGTLNATNVVSSAVDAKTNAFAANLW